MNAKQLREIVDESHISSHKALKQSICRRLETAAVNGHYAITFDPKSFDGPFLLPETARKQFLDELTKEGFEIECETRWWKRKTIKISWENS
jgi:hypothetical protein